MCRRLKQREILDSQISMSDVKEITRLNDIASCQRYLKYMLDFYFDAIEFPRNSDSRMLLDANLWLQTIFTKGCAFLDLLNGIKYEKPGVRLNTILDPSLLFTIARRIYESVVDFNMLYIYPETQQQKDILYNLFMAAGLSERLKNWNEDMRSKYPERVQEEEKDIQDCKTAIENNELWSSLRTQTQQVIYNAIESHKFRYKFNSGNVLCPVKWKNAYELLRVKKDIYESMYSFLSLHSHPSYLALIQFRDAYIPDIRQDVQMAIHTTQCVLSFMSIFIVDYMKLFPNLKTHFEKLELPKQFLIGMYEDVMRGEKKYK